jgi:hypothetical protein
MMNDEERKMGTDIACLLSIYAPCAIPFRITLAKQEKKT